MTLRTSLFLAALIAVPVALGVWKFGLGPSEVRGSGRVVETSEPTAPSADAPASQGLVAATQSEPAVEIPVEPEPAPAPAAEPERVLTPAETVAATWKRPRGVTPEDFRSNSSQSMLRPDGEKLLMKVEEGGLDVDSLSEAEQEAYEKAVQKRRQLDGRGVRRR